MNGGDLPRLTRFLGGFREVILSRSLTGLLVGWKYSIRVFLCFFSTLPPLLPEGHATLKGACERGLTYSKQTEFEGHTVY